MNFQNKNLYFLLLLLKDYSKKYVFVSMGTNSHIIFIVVISLQSLVNPLLRSLFVLNTKKKNISCFFSFPQISSKLSHPQRKIEVQVIYPYKLFFDLQFQSFIPFFCCCRHKNCFSSLHLCLSAFSGLCISFWSFDGIFNKMFKLKFTTIYSNTIRT